MTTNVTIPTGFLSYFFISDIHFIFSFELFTFIMYSFHYISHFFLFAERSLLQFPYFCFERISEYHDDWLVSVDWCNYQRCNERIRRALVTNYGYYYSVSGKMKINKMVLYSPKEKWKKSLARFNAKKLINSFELLEIVGEVCVFNFIIAIRFKATNYFKLTNFHFMVSLKFNRHF